MKVREHERGITLTSHSVALAELGKLEQKSSDACYGPSRREAVNGAGERYRGCERLRLRFGRGGGPILYISA
jgi:hypothetical protein